MAITPWPGRLNGEDPAEHDEDAFTVAIRPIYEDELDEYLDELDAEDKSGRFQAQQ